MGTANEQIAAIARGQHGLFARAQAIAVGIKDRTIDTRVANGIYERLHPHVLGVTGTASTWHRSAVAAVLSAGPVSAASHQTAAYLWELWLAALTPDSGQSCSLCPIYKHSFAESPNQDAPESG